MLSTKFRFIWLSDVSGEDFFLEIDQPETRMAYGDQMVLEKIFFNWPITNQNCIWWPCLLMDWDEMNNLYRRPSLDASYQVSGHLAKRFQRRRFFSNRPTRIKYCL